MVVFGERHSFNGMISGVGGGVTSGFFLIVTIAPVSDGTALKDTFPEYVVAETAVIDPPLIVEFKYLKLSRLSIQISVLKAVNSSFAAF